MSGQLHGNDYFAGHLRPSSAWLNVMDGEEMVMPETLLVVPDLSHSIITVTQFDWAQIELCPSASEWDPLKICSLPTPRPQSIHFLNWNVKELSSCWSYWGSQLLKSSLICWYWCLSYTLCWQIICNLISLHSHKSLWNDFFLDPKNDKNDAAAFKWTIHPGTTLSWSSIQLWLYHY